MQLALIKASPAALFAGMHRVCVFLRIALWISQVVAGVCVCVDLSQPSGTNALLFLAFD
jgi:hypothetical protein